MENNSENGSCCACFSNKKPIVRKAFTSDSAATDCVSQLVDSGHAPELCLGHNGTYYICHQHCVSD